MTMRFLATAALAAGLAHLALPALAQGGPTLKTVKDRGVLNCTGHDGSFLGFAELDDQGNWRGLDIDLCRAVATAIFGDPSHLQIVPISWAQRWPALQTGEIDINIKASGATRSRDQDLGLQFSYPYFFGTTSIMAHASLGITSLEEADGGSICIPAGTTIERKVASYIEEKKLTLETVIIENTQELEQAYFSGRCDTYAQWGPTLAIARLARNAVDEHVMLSDQLTFEPIVMITRQGDDNWVDIANWVLTTIIFAEQEGITSENVDDMRANPPNVEIARVLGATSGYGSALGLSDDYGYNVIRHVGNFSEIFERNLGQDSPYRMERGMTALWNAGGALFPLMID